MTVSQSDFGTQFAWDTLLGWATVGTGVDRSMSFVQTSEDAAAWGDSGFVALQEDLAQRLATNGAERSRLLQALDRSKSRALEDIVAVSRIADTDVASEVTSLARNSLRAQSSVSLHTQANVLAEAALRVLVG
jgi:flagellin-like hook-associated protein FlgL